MWDPPIEILLQRGLKIYTESFIDINFLKYQKRYTVVVNRIKQTEIKKLRPSLRLKLKNHFKLIFLKLNLLNTAQCAAHMKRQIIINQLLFIPIYLK